MEETDVYSACFWPIPCLLSKKEWILSFQVVWGSLFGELASTVKHCVFSCLWSCLSRKPWQRMLQPTQRQANWKDQFAISYFESRFFLIETAVSSVINRDVWMSSFLILDVVGVDFQLCAIKKDQFSKFYFISDCFILGYFPFCHHVTFQSPWRTWGFLATRIITRYHCQIVERQKTEVVSVRVLLHTLGSTCNSWRVLLFHFKKMVLVFISFWELSGNW